MIVETAARMESILALSEALEGKDITEQESENNIADNLVSVVGFDGEPSCHADGSIRVKAKGACTGLLITTDGFVLTAYHAISLYIDDWKRIRKEHPPTEANVNSWLEDVKMRYVIVDQNRGVYPIDVTFYARDPFRDIALIKAVNFRKPKPVPFLTATRDLEVDDTIKLLGLKDQRPHNQYGQVINASTDQEAKYIETGKKVFTYDTFLTDAYAVPGFSGGPFLTSRGEFAGVALYSQLIGIGEIGHAGGGKVRNIVNLVKIAVDELYKAENS